MERKVIQIYVDVIVLNLTLTFLEKETKYAQNLCIYEGRLLCCTPEVLTTIKLQIFDYHPPT